MSYTVQAAPAWWHWHRRLYNWVIHFADTPYGERALFLLSFAESSFFPVPPDVLLAPLTLGAPKKWLRFAVSCSIASVLGGIVGYLIGLFLWEQIGQWVFAHLGVIGFTQTNFDKFQAGYQKYDFWIVFTCGFTPLPYKVCTITAGIARIMFPGFLLASALSRSARFFLVAGLFGWKGEQIRPFIDKYFNWLSLVFVMLLIGGFAVLKLLHH
ncbi:MAG TPA: YqaA family protein [Anaerohalosphaeraceae bacterium]|nr:DedA family protein [Phycisphaerae bacterium]HOK95701.1 YqaA family protein [Anaerohalosphaeraceae bacterium]HOL30694.1 YqaA family protein [Anaerohalosphaeraceae bacterium]HOM75126.1 YqaA family protein [Anaerohalosphaeraceae bacterium]HPC63435.1 YqaA family protein [Anaerohalosphaeraceae bacterium]